MSRILDSDEIEAIGGRSWRLDAPRAALRCPRWPRGLHGTGSLETNDKGLLLRFYPTNTERFDVWKVAMTFPPRGEIISDRWYARGVLEDSRGRHWQLTRFEPSFDSGPSGFTISGYPRYVRSKKRLAHSVTGDVGEIHFFPSLAFPPNTWTTYSESIGADVVRGGNRFDAAMVEVSGASLRFLNGRHGECQVHSPNAPLPSAWGFRVCEALQFITARWHEWTVMSSRTGSRECLWVRSPIQSEPSQLRPPMDSASPAEAAIAWRMFSRYLGMIWNDAESRLTRLGGAHRSIIRASCATVEAEALQLAVSIESLLREEFPDARESVVVDEGDIAKAVDAIQGADLSPNMQRRLLGAIGALKRPRPQEILAVLERSGRMRRGWSRRYGELRNPSAHGQAVDGDIQDLVDLCSMGLTIFHELVLTRIGYSGLYTDHSRRDAPTIEFPPSSQDPSG